VPAKVTTRRSCERQQAEGRRQKAGGRSRRQEQEAVHTVQALIERSKIENQKSKILGPLTAFSRVTLIVLDGAGIGEMPDASDWGDAGSDTLGHILESRTLTLPHLQSYGLGNIRPLAGLPSLDQPTGSYGRCALRSNGKDTTTGHWEMAGIILDQAFPTYPSGYPASIIDRFIAETGVPGILGNITASGTEIIKELGAEHVETGKPIVYTSADSVFQIAAHEEVIPLGRLYELCETARRILDGPHRVGRVIARPFLGPKGFFYRTENRHDYAVPPPSENLLPVLAAAGLEVVCIGKIASIYDSVGVTRDLEAKNNQQSVDRTVQALGDDARGLIFSNLVDFDMLYGHRRDTEGYARALELFDESLAEIENAMRDDDLLIITADHGNDPTFPGSDHTREYAPLLVYGKRARPGVNLGTRDSLSDIGQTIAENFGLKLSAGKSFLGKISNGSECNQ
jgi:phosphopentomutase